MLTVRDWREILGLVILLSVVSGCGAGVAAEGDDGMATYEVDADHAAEEALISGVLSFVDGCVVLGDGTVPVFPEGEATWQDEQLVWRGESYALGALLELPGGEGGPETPLPAACSGRVSWIVAPE